MRHAKPKSELKLSSTIQLLSIAIALTNLSVLHDNLEIYIYIYMFVTEKKKEIEAISKFKS